MIETWFPISIFYEDLEPPEQVTQDMMDYVDNFYNTHKSEFLDKKNITGDVYNDFTIHKKPEFQWLTQNVSRCCKQYLKEMGADTSKIKVYAQKSWPVVCKRNGGDVGTHTHRNAMISAVYYLKAKDNETGKLTFYSPLDVSLSPIPLDIQNYYSYDTCEYAPKENRIILFPSKLKHSVDEYQASDNRYSISYDLTLVANEGVGDNEHMVVDPSLWSHI